MQASKYKMICAEQSQGKRQKDLVGRGIDLNDSVQSTLGSIS